MIFVPLIEITDSVQRFRGADHQNSSGIELGRDTAEEIFSVFHAEIDRHITAKNDIKFSQPGERLHEILFPEKSHGSKFVFDLPVSFVRDKIFV
jgi:hypothetical protein